MEHSFDVDIAKRFGVNAAIIFKNIYHWVEKNRANEKNCYDGRYWTYNSIKAFHELFPYLSEKQIRTAINVLIDGGAIVTGNYNKQPYDRTLWYSVTDEWEGSLKSTLPFDQKDIYILLKGKMEIDEKQNENIQNGEPIPDINTDKNFTDINTDINTSVGKPTTHKRKPPEAKEILGEYQHVKLSSSEKERLYHDYGTGETEEAIAFLDEYIEMKGTKYKSHYLAMRRWVFDAVEERKQRKRKVSGDGRLSDGGYDWDSL